jgi:hypothetical protein
MTPKEKAEELVDRYFKLLNYEFGDLVYSLRDKQPKQCALIAVQYIITANPHSNPLNTDVYSTMKYWEEVKQEIEKL